MIEDCDIFLTGIVILFGNESGSPCFRSCLFPMAHVVFTAPHGGASNAFALYCFAQ